MPTHHSPTSIYEAETMRVAGCLIFVLGFFIWIPNLGAAGLGLMVTGVVLLIVGVARAHQQQPGDRVAQDTGAFVVGVLAAFGAVGAGQYAAEARNPSNATALAILCAFVALWAFTSRSGAGGRPPKGNHLKKLRDLRAAGVLSEEEFRQKAESLATRKPTRRVPIEADPGFGPRVDSSGSELGLIAELGGGAFILGVFVLLTGLGVGLGATWGVGAPIVLAGAIIALVGQWTGKDDGYEARRAKAFVPPAGSPNEPS